MACRRREMAAAALFSTVQTVKQNRLQMNHVLADYRVPVIAGIALMGEGGGGGGGGPPPPPPPPLSVVTRVDTIKLNIPERLANG